MNGTVAFPRWSSRRSLWFLVAVLVPFVGSGPATAIPRRHMGVAEAAFVSLLAVAIGGLQLRHSLAASRGERPAGAAWTFLAMVALVYLPIWAYGYDWAIMQFFVVASGAMVLPRRLAAAAVAGPLAGYCLVVALDGVNEGARASLIVAVTVYIFALVAMSAAALYGSAWLVRVLDDLFSARTELAELAVGRERLRVSRDLHDLLGQSLSAVSLKGDLALRLLPTDTAAARAEIESLTGVARAALRDVRAVARDEHAVSLDAELAAAAALLEAAGIATHVDVDLTGLPGAVESMLAWAVREGATNTLRHSEATAWWATGRRSRGRARLEIVNDGASSTVSTEGSGLSGLAERARVLAGTASAGPADGDRFRLVVEVPDVPETAEVAP